MVKVTVGGWTAGWVTHVLLVVVHGPQVGVVAPVAQVEVRVWVMEPV